MINLTPVLKRPASKVSLEPLSSSLQDTSRTWIECLSCQSIAQAAATARRPRCAAAAAQLQLQLRINVPCSSTKQEPQPLDLLSGGRTPCCCIAASFGCVRAPQRDAVNACASVHIFKAAKFAKGLEKFHGQRWTSIAKVVQVQSGFNRRSHHAASSPDVPGRLPADSQPPPFEACLSLFELYTRSLACLSRDLLCFGYAHPHQLCSSGTRSIQTDSTLDVRQDCVVLVQ